jgi:hypothetical protein
MKVTMNVTLWVLTKLQNSVSTTRHIMQRGQPRTAEATRAEINEQVRMAMRG